MEKQASAEHVTALWNSGKGVGAIAKEIGYSWKGTARLLARLQLRRRKYVK